MVKECNIITLSSIFVHNHQHYQPVDLCKKYHGQNCHNLLGYNFAFRLTLSIDIKTVNIISTKLLYSLVPTFMYVVER